MKEYRDSSGRLSIELSGNCGEFDSFAKRMISRFGDPIERLDGLDQRYWDFRVDGVTLVIHADTFAGVSIYVEDGTRDEMLRSIAETLMAKRQDSDGTSRSQ